MCCGTHVLNLSALQGIKLLQTEGIKGNTRVHFVVGQAVLTLLGELFDRVGCCLFLLSSVGLRAKGSFRRAYTVLFFFAFVARNAS